MLPGMGATMRTIKFGTGKLAVGAIAGILLLAIGLPMLFGDVFLAIMGIVFVVGGPLASASSVKRLLGDGVALQYDTAGLRVATRWSSETFRWAQVKGIGRSQFVTRMWGIIPVSRQNFIDFKVEGGLFGSRTIRLAAASLDVRKCDLDGLVSDLQSMLAGARKGALAATAVQADAPLSRGRDPLEGAPRDEGFDADAALAHYLANRPAPEPQPVAASAGMPARPAFGRKGI